MKKVAIITIICRNYGNRLQNYALQTTLYNMGFHCETIPLIEAFYLKSVFKILIKAPLSCFFPKYKNKCWDIFNFNILWSKHISQTSKLNSYYDYFIAGSDQIWNPMLRFNSDREFLTFAEDKKKVAYAASIGIEILPDRCVERFQNNLKNFKNISVRENAAATLIEGLGLPKPMVVLDPTMLLSVDQWMRVAKRKKVFAKKRYVVKYFLGKYNDEVDDLIAEKALELNADIIDISSDNPSKQYNIGPAEFISLFFYSKIVFTDSFHGSVFSILFHKPFLVFDRPYEEGTGKMTSRLDTLLNIFELESQRINDTNNIPASLEWNYEKVDGILNLKRNESIEFLKHALDLD